MSCCISNYDNKPCPLRMSDGRSFTDYNTRCVFNSYLANKLKNNNMVKSSNEMRLYLQNNYETILKEDRQRAVNNINPIGKEVINITNKQLDNKYTIRCDEVSCSTVLTNPEGLGTTNFF